MNDNSVQQHSLNGRGNATTWLIVVACCCTYVVLCLIYFDATIDDAYISYRYARNFSEGYGLTFNKTGKPVEGYSNFLWVVILAGTHRLGADIPIASKVLGILSGLAILILLPFFMRRACPDEEGKSSGMWLAIFLLCPLAPFVFWSVTGMETVFYAFLVTLAVYLRIGEIADKVKFPFSGLVFAAVALTRPEGAMFFFATAIFVLALWKFKGRKPTRKDILWVALFLIPFVVYLLWRYSYYGYWLPNTYYAKSASLTLARKLKNGFLYLGNFTNWVGIGFLAIAFVPIVLVRRTKPTVAFVTSLIVIEMLFVLAAGADWMPDFRFMVPVLPIFCICLALGLLVLLDQIKNALRAKYVFLVLMALVIFLGAFRVFQVQRSGKKWQEITRRLHSAHGGIADYLVRHAPRDATVVLMDVGLIPYTTDLHIIDLCGLTDERLAHTPGTWGIDKSDTEYVLTQKPDYIVISVMDKRGLNPENTFVLPEKKLLQRILEDKTYKKVFEKEFIQYTLVLLERK